MNSSPIKVLIVEDDKQIRRFLRLTLETEGVVVVEAESGYECIAQMRRQSPDLVLLDLGLPDIGGVEVITSLRTWTSVPIIVISARSAEVEKVAALDSGADDYLTKPFGNLELMARLRAHMRKRGRGPDGAGPVLRFGDVSVDFALRQITRGSAPVHLTPTEFRLLSVLLHSPEKVLTHNFLLQAVWGGGYAERHHYLRIYMANLRRKLEKNAARPVHITTETGVGYRFRANTLDDS